MNSSRRQRRMPVDAFLNARARKALARLVTPARAGKPPRRRMPGPDRAHAAAHGRGLWGAQ
jgi:hypothetical protein